MSTIQKTQRVLVPEVKRQRRGTQGPRKLKINAVRYHRNGISGIGFFAIDFIFEKRRLLATIWTNDEHTDTEYYAVVSADNVIDRWRGDNFTDDLLAAIRTAVESGSAFNHQSIADAAAGAASPSLSSSTN